MMVRVVKGAGGRIIGQGRLVQVIIHSALAREIP